MDLMTPYRWSAHVGVQLGVLAAAAYVYAVAEMAPIGAMPAIAADLHVSEAHVGMLTAAYAFISVLATVPLVRWTRRWPRRRALVLTLVCLTVSQTLSALAPGLETLAASRVLCAITHGLMWAIIVPIGARLVPPLHVVRATTAIYVGTAAALVVGNPLTTSMSMAWGWRPTVAVLAISSAAITILAQVVLPAMPAAIDEASSPIVRKPLYRNDRLMMLCGLTLIGVTAHFTSYTFIVPIVRDIVGVDGPRAAWILIAYGIFGLVTMALLSRAVDQRLRVAVAVSLVVLCLAFWSLTALSDMRAGVVATVIGSAAIMVWGASAAALPPMLQSAAVRTAPDQAVQASAFYVTAFQIGILAGSITGGLVDAHFGISAVVAVSSALFTLALAGVFLRGEVFDPPAREESRPGQANRVAVLQD